MLPEYIIPNFFCINFYNFYTVLFTFPPDPLFHVDNGNSLYQFLVGFKILDIAINMIVRSPSVTQYKPWS